ncbi:MAG: hypothetical protein KGH57_04430 [Candidatus Micrarchaeota archaeon]|nr:hypothetical protein [Candidatus Micrarchaeota archaeon]
MRQPAVKVVREASERAGAAQDTGQILLKVTTDVTNLASFDKHFKELRRKHAKEEPEFHPIYSHVRSGYHRGNFHFRITIESAVFKDDERQKTLLLDFLAGVKAAMAREKSTKVPAYMRQLPTIGMLINSSRE